MLQYFNVFVALMQAGRPQAELRNDSRHTIRSHYTAVTYTQKWICLCKNKLHAICTPQRKLDLSETGLEAVRSTALGSGWLLTRGVVAGQRIFEHRILNLLSGLASFQTNNF